MPFHHLRSPVVACAILRGERPGIPLNALSLGFTDALWELLQSCWDESVVVRPTAQQLVDHLRPAYHAWVPPRPSPAAGEVVNTPSSGTFAISMGTLSGSVCQVQ